jgi:hypothetical protein
MDRAVSLGLASKPLSVPTRVRVNEKSAGRGQDYITIVSDLDAGTVAFIADERRQASMDGYLEQFTAGRGRGRPASSAPRPTGRRHSPLR